MVQFENVTVVAQANVYFDGKVISHTILLSDGARKTLGVILPGSFHFGTESPERMEIVGGSCSYILDGSEDSADAPTGVTFEVPGSSGFTITVVDEPCHYVCTFLS
jgi:purine/pyrimidine-nucleoside phosphorylase